MALVSVLKNTYRHKTKFMSLLLKFNAMKILACQIEISAITSPAQRDNHVTRIAAQISKHIKEAGGVDLVVLPELSTIKYSKAAFENLEELAEEYERPLI